MRHFPLKSALAGLTLLAFAACGAAADTVSAGPDAAPFGVFRM